MTTRDVAIQVLTDPPDPALVEQVVNILLKGGVAVLPTDTVYGLCAAAESEAGVRRVFELKGRDTSKALPVFVGNLSQARAVAELNIEAERLASVFWPGALTLILKRRPGIAWNLGGDPHTIGIRWPQSRFVSEICLRAGPITSTSANASGAPEAKTVTQAVEAFGSRVDLYVDGGPSPTEVPSTVVSLVSDPQILREGAISAAEFLGKLR
ncbi:MAG: threonylcarbamoyl-AMP synthase [Acidimicrobiia bacterium]